MASENINNQIKSDHVKDKRVTAVNVDCIPTMHYSSSIFIIFAIIIPGVVTTEHQLNQLNRCKQIERPSFD